jgi:hypothetical protein
MRWRYIIGCLALGTVVYFHGGWVAHHTGKAIGIKEGSEAGYAQGFKEGRLFQATVTPVIIQEKVIEVKVPVTIQDLDQLSAFDIYEYLKQRNQRDQRRWNAAEGKIL